MHRIAFPARAGTAGISAAAGGIGEHIIVTGAEAEHAVRVKRVSAGEVIELLDGRGGVAAGTVSRVHPVKGGRSGKGDAAIEVIIESTATVAPLRPRIEVWAATPKGARVDELVDGLSQVGAAAWIPLRTDRGVVMPREAKLERLERIAWESAKQCGRAWLLEIGQERPLSDALHSRTSSHIVVADAAGEPHRAVGADAVRLLIGPEGGWSEAERAAARQAGATLACFGPHTMRIETAAVAASAVVFDLEAREAPHRKHVEGGAGS